MTDDFLIDDMGVHLAASKNPDYKKRVRQRFCALVDFLLTNGLATRALEPPSDMNVNSFKITRFDLTDEGFEVIKVAYDKWLRGHDWGKPVDDVSSLRRALEKIR